MGKSVQILVSTVNSLGNSSFKQTVFYLLFFLKILNISINIAILNLTYYILTSQYKKGGET
jgi:hypothetical protein